MKSVKVHHGQSLERLYRRLKGLRAAGVRIPRDESEAVKHLSDIILYDTRKAEREANRLNVPPPGFGRL